MNTSIAHTDCDNHRVYRNLDLKMHGKTVEYERTSLRNLWIEVGFIVFMLRKLISRKNLSKHFALPSKP